MRTKAPGSLVGHLHFLTALLFCPITHARLPPNALSSALLRLLSCLLQLLFLLPYFLVTVSYIPFSSALPLQTKWLWTKSHPADSPWTGNCDGARVSDEKLCELRPTFCEFNAATAKCEWRKSVFAPAGKQHPYYPPAAAQQLAAQPQQLAAAKLPPAINTSELIVYICTEFICTCLTVIPAHPVLIH